eukprot:223224_1
MAAPRQHNKSGKSWVPFLLKSGGACVVLSGAYYYYKHHMQEPQAIQHNPTPPPFPLYTPTDLGDFEDTDDTNTTFYTTTPAGDGAKMDVRQEYISNLLQQRRTVSVLCNPHLNHHKVEHFFHLGFNSSSPILAQFNRIKWVIIVRSKSDVKLVAQRILNEFPQFKQEKDGNELPKPIGSTDRFYMIKISSILIVSCGIGAASMSILLQELTKVLVDAGAFAPNENNSSLTYQTSYVEYILLISAPGIKTAPSAKVYERRKSMGDIYATEKKSSGATTPRGTLSSLRFNLQEQRLKTSEVFGGKSSNVFDDDFKQQRPSQTTRGEIPVIIPTSCYNESLTNGRSFAVCGQNVTRQMKFDRNLISDIKIRCSFLRSLKPRMGKGLSVQYFHEALSHNSVAINQEDNVKLQFIQKCIEQNIKYVDMESGYFAAFCNTLNISCVAIVGIEYDIAAPSKSEDSMRVTHDRALEATMDVFCQYLWDRISQDLQIKNMKRNKSQEIEKQPVVLPQDAVQDEQDMIAIPDMDRANSYSGPVSNTVNVLKPKAQQEIIPPPAAFSNGNFAEIPQIHNEGT